MQVPRVLSSSIKYAMKLTIVYSKKKAKERRSVLVSLEERLKRVSSKMRRSSNTWKS